MICIYCTCNLEYKKYIWYSFRIPFRQLSHGLGHFCKIFDSPCWCHGSENEKTRLGWTYGSQVVQQSKHMTTTLEISVIVDPFPSWPPGGVIDPEVENLARYRKSQTGRERCSNAARDFNRWVHRDGRIFPVPIKKLKVRVRVRQRNQKGKVRIFDKKMGYPVIFLSDWFEKVMELHPKFFLGGFDLDNDQTKWKAMFSDFWRWFEDVDPSHPIHQKPMEEKAYSIPIALHGDEGRGLAKTPLMVWSFQVIIPSTGPNNLNTGQQHDTTRKKCWTHFFF